MKELFKIIVVAVFCLSSPISSWCQNQTKNAIEEAGWFEIYTVRDSWLNKDYFNPYKLCQVNVSKCDVDMNDFNAFFSRNPQYCLQDKKTRTEYKYRREFIYVTSFSFRNNKDMLSCVELCVQCANKNFNLKLPSFQNFNEANAFYQKYVRPFPKVVEVFKEEFVPKLSEYLQNNPDAMKRFCEGSPYQNNELAKEIDVWSLLLQCNKKYDYVYYLTADNGYFFDKSGAFKYQGDIRNGKPNGKGKNWGWERLSKVSWEGTFKDGKKDGSFTCTYYYFNRTDDLKEKLTGTCVDDEWEGEVVKETTCKNSSYSNIDKEYYSKGKLVKSELISDRMSKDLEEQERIRREQKALEEKRAREREAERRQRESSVNVNNVMNEVKSIEKEGEDSSCIKYTVRFKDGKSGWIRYWKSDGKWGAYVGDLWNGYDEPSPNSKEAAILLVYKYEHHY